MAFTPLKWESASQGFAAVQGDGIEVFKITE
jgi:hypothetical protein